MSFVTSGDFCHPLRAKFDRLAHLFYNKVILLNFNLGRSDFSQLTIK